MKSRDQVSNFSYLEIPIFMGTSIGEEKGSLIFLVKDLKDLLKEKDCSGKKQRILCSRK